MRRPSRRAFLASATAVALAGCTDGERAANPGTGTEPPGTDTAGPTTEPHPTGTATPGEVHADCETTEVRVRTPEGDPLGSVTAAIADSANSRYLGLSDTESLPEDRGMLFVYEYVSDRTFVMREMDFGIDVVFADHEGVITRIHHAPAPGPEEDGSEQEYPGRGQYVLEVNYEWTADRGVEEGDVLDFDL